MSSSLESYVISKNGWGRFGRLKLLWSSLRGRRVAWLCAVAALGFEAFFVFASPVVVQLTIDSVIGDKFPSFPFTLRPIAQWLFGPDLNGGGALPLAHPGSGEWVWRSVLRDNVWALALAFIACVALQAAFSFVAGFLSNAAAERSAKANRDRIYGHIQDLPYETLLRAQSGDWLQRCTSDVDTARRFVCMESMELCRTVFLVAFALPVMFSLNLRLAFWGCVVVPVIVLFSIGFHVVVERFFLGVDEREGVLSGIIQENVTGVRVVRAFARQLYERERFSRANDAFRDQVFKLIVALCFFWSVTSFLGLLQIAIVTGLGVGMIGRGTLTIGLLFLFIAYEHQVLWPIRQFGRVLADIGKTKVALGRMAELLNLPVEEGLDRVPGKSEGNAESQASTPESAANWASGAIEFDHIAFSYPDGTGVLDDVSLRIEPGERIAIVGPTGSGKSSLVHLLTRFYEPSSGTIRIGGRDIREVPKRELRSRIALVLQEGFLYGKTIRENIRMGRKDASESLIVEASTQAALHSVIEGFSAGYETMVGERGVTLSGGQRQRVSLARAFVREAPILILDDSLSAVDTETDGMIREALARANRKTTTIIIAHRITTLASADRIVVLEGGRVTAVGTHDELMLLPGLYRRLAELQGARTKGNGNV